MREITHVLDAYSYQKGVKETLESQKKSSTQILTQLRKKQEDIALFTQIVQEVAQDTQNQVKLHIDEVVTLALQTIFTDKNYTFSLEIESKRGTTVAVPVVYDDGNPIIDLLTDSGGLADIVAFSLRIAFLTLSKQRKVLVIDEPFKQLSQAYIEVCGEFLQEIASKLEVQIIMPTHIREMKDYSDNVFLIKSGKGGSIVDTYR